MRPIKFFGSTEGILHRGDMSDIYVISVTNVTSDASATSATLLYKG